MKANSFQEVRAHFARATRDPLCIHRQWAAKEIAGHRPGTRAAGNVGKETMGEMIHPVRGA
jgi:hypothetical protein